MSNAKEYATHFLKIEEHAKELQSLLSQEFGYKLTTVLNSYHGLFERFCPYKIGDRVQLTKDPEILYGSGWYGYKHFLIKGAIATVESQDFRDGKFRFGLIFDDESWISSIDGKITKAHPAPHHIFGFSEDYLELEKR